MTDKEKFLSIKTYEEFNRRRGEFKELSMADEEIRASAETVKTGRGSMAAAFIRVF